MELKERVIYCKLDDNNIIQGYIYLKQNNPQIIYACNFNIDEDLNTAIKIDDNLFSKLFVGYSQIINGMFYSNEPIQI